MSISSAREEKQKKILIIIVCVVILYVDFSYILKAQTQGLNGITPKITRLKNDLNNLNRDLNNMRALKSKQPLGEEKAAVKSATIIPESQIIDLLQNISELANKSDVKISQIRPSREAGGQKPLETIDKYIPLFINLEVICDYHSFGKFVNALENARIFMAVQEFKIQAQSPDYMRQKITLVLRTYVTK
ncbi:MAG: type 4a pilus biogenesis protein PilO [Candidatus Omnitrophota bacterium]